MSLLEDLRTIYNNCASDQVTVVPASQVQIENAIRKAYKRLSIKDERALKDAEFEMLFGDNEPKGKFAYLAPKRACRR